MFSLPRMIILSNYKSRYLRLDNCISLVVAFNLGEISFIKHGNWGWSQGGAGIGQGDHFSLTNTSKDHLNVEQLHKTILNANRDSRHPERQPNLFERT